MIILEPIFHRGTPCIAIRGKYKASVLRLMRSLLDLRYSATHKCFYTTFTDSRLNILRKELPSVETEIKDIWDEMIVHADFSGSSPEEKITFPPSYHEHLIKRRYSEATCLNYKAQFTAFLHFIFPKTADEFTEAEIHAYQLHWHVTERSVILRRTRRSMRSSFIWRR